MPVQRSLLDRSGYWKRWLVCCLLFGTAAPTDLWAQSLAEQQVQAIRAFNANNIDEADIAFQALLDAARLKKDAYREAAALWWLSEIAFTRRDYKQTLAKADQARQLLEKRHFSDTSKLYFRCLESMGVASSYLGDKVNQGIYYKRCLRFARQLLPVDSSLLADAYTDMGAFFKDRFQVDSALWYIEASAAICERMERLDLLTTNYLNLGYLYAVSNDFTAALTYQQRALKINNDPYQQILGLTHLAEYYQYLKQPDEALSQLNMARWMVFMYGFEKEEINAIVELAACSVYETKGDTTALQSTVAQLLNWLPAKDSILRFQYLKLRNLDMGIALSSKRFDYILAQSDTLLLANPPDSNGFPEHRIRTYLLRAEALAALGQFNQSLQDLQMAWRTLVPAYEGGRWNQTPLLSELGNAEQAFEILSTQLRILLQAHAANPSNNTWLDDAQQIFQRGDALLFENRKRLSTRLSRGVLTHIAKPFYWAGVDLYYRYYTQQQDLHWIDQAFACMDRSKALVIAESRSQYQAGSQWLPKSLTDTLNALVWRGDYLRAMLYDQAADKRKAAQDQLFQLERDVQALENRLKNSFSAYYDLRFSAETPSLHTLQRQLRAPEHILAYSVQDTALYSILISRDTAVFQRHLPKKQLAGQVDALNKAIVQRSDDYYALAWALFQDILEPLYPLVKGGELYVIPDGPLWTVPFHALVVAPPLPAGTLRPNDIEYLINTTQTGYWYTTHARSDANEASKSRASLPWVGLAPFPFTMPENDFQLSALPGSLSEGNSSHGQFNGGEFFVGRSASTASFYYALQHASIAHAATHTLLHPTNPDLTQLCFAASGGEGQAFSGVFVYELYTRQVLNELLVLTACHSSNVQHEHTNDLSGLAHAFAVAGCRGVLASMWSVNDAIAPEMIQQFYANLQSGQGKVTALHNALQKHLHDGDDLLKHPYYWANFILIGDNAIIHFDEQPPVPWQWIMGWLIVVALSVRGLVPKTAKQGM